MMVHVQRRRTEFVVFHNPLFIRLFYAKFYKMKSYSFMARMNVSPLTDHWFHIHEEIRVIRSLVAVVCITFTIFKTSHRQKAQPLFPRGTIPPNPKHRRVVPRAGVEPGTHPGGEKKFLLRRRIELKFTCHPVHNHPVTKIFRLLFYLTRGILGWFLEINGTCYLICAIHYTPTNTIKSKSYFLKWHDRQINPRFSQW